MARKCIAINSSVSIGATAPTAINVLIGANHYSSYSEEENKIHALLECGYPVTIISDLSLVSFKNKIPLWQLVCEDGRCIAGTVPVYQTVNENGTIEGKKLLELIQSQAENGVRIITIHPTPSRELIEKSKERLVPITSRGGGVVCKDMIIKGKSENVYMQILDDIIAVARRESVVLSIGSSFRSANLHDALDATFFLELSKQLEIAEYCNRRGVEAIIETPGHAAPQDIFQLCDYLNQACPFPVMPLGPIPTDCAFAQDDLAATIGAVLMGTRGCADILSVVTRDEHLGGIPSKESILEAVKKYSIAKHIIDIYKTGNKDSDYEVAFARSKKRSCLADGKDCSRCAALCPLKTPFIR